jgi:hypothetical protein
VGGDVEHREAGRARTVSVRVFAELIGRKRRARRAKKRLECGKQKAPGSRSFRGLNWGVGARHALFPNRRHLALDRSGRLPAPRRHSPRHAELSVS